MIGFLTIGDSGNFARLLIRLNPKNNTFNECTAPDPRGATLSLLRVAIVN
jgi:hypothetical protein